MANSEVIDNVAQIEFDRLQKKVDLKKFLTNDEIIYLQGHFKKGSIEARNLVIESTTGLRYSAAKAYRHLEEMDDLANEAVFGVVRALEKYDSSEGYKFTTYAFSWIRNSMTDHLERTKGIRIPRYLFWDMLKVNNYIEKCLNNNEDEPTDEKIHRKTKVSLKRIERIRKLPELNPVSLNSVVGEDTELIDLQPDYNSPSTDSTSVNYPSLLSMLSPNQKRVIVYRHGLDNGSHLRTFREVALMINRDKPTAEGRETISRGRAEQIYAKGIKKVKAAVAKELAV